MNKKIKTIRDLSLVEKELSSSRAGVISVPTISEHSFTQFASSFVYQDKNIFVFITNPDLLKILKYDSLARFTVIKEKNVSKDLVDKSDVLYRLFSVVVTGILKKAEEKKTIKEIEQSFIEKYTGKLLLPGKDSRSNGKLLFIDSEELLAFDEIGH